MKIKNLILILTCLAFIPSLVFAFGQVAGPVVIHVPLGGSGAGNWGIFNNEAIIVKITAEGDAAKYISFPEKVTLEPNNKINWIDITAKIPSDYDFSQETNITGTIYALEEGKPGQVQINLQLKKSIYIIVEQPQILESEIQLGKSMTGFFVLQPAYSMFTLGLILAAFIVLVYFMKTKKEVKD